MRLDSYKSLLLQWAHPETAEPCFELRHRQAHIVIESYIAVL